MSRIDWTQRAREFLKTAPPLTPKTTETYLSGVLAVRPPLVFQKSEAANEPTQPSAADLPVIPKAVPTTPVKVMNLPDSVRELLTLSDAELIRMEARYRLARRHGLDIDQTERLADDLLRRDRQGLDMRMCVECRCLESTGRCAAARAGRLAGADRRFEPIRTELIRCPAFAPNTRD